MSSGTGRIGIVTNIYPSVPLSLTRQRKKEQAQKVGSCKSAEK